MSQVKTYIIKYNNPKMVKGTTVNIFFIKNELDTADILVIVNIMTELYNKMYKWYDTDPFDGYVLNVYDDQDPAIPKTRTECGGDGVCWVVPGLDRYSGLTFQDAEMTEVHDEPYGKYSTKAEYFENLLSHEFWHELIYKAGFNDLKNKVRPKWLELVGGDDPEIPAEYGRKLHGSGRSANTPVRESWVQPELIKGVDNLLLIWPKITAFIKSKEDNGNKVYDISYDYSDWDAKYIGCLLHVEYSPADKKGYYLDRVGLQQYFPPINNKPDYWKFIKYF